MEQNQATSITCCVPELTRLSPLSELKQLNWLSVVGLLLVLCGEALRKAAMLTAGSNFNHIVQNEKAQSHVLVTGGVYAYFRHPSYVGWFYWSTGTQVSGALSSNNVPVAPSNVRCVSEIMLPSDAHLVGVFRLHDVHDVSNTKVQTVNLF